VPGPGAGEDPSAEPPGAALPEQMAVRRAKLDRLRAAGRDPFTAAFEPTATAAELRTRHGGLGPDERTGDRVAVAGRVLRKRDGGRICFATIRDASADLQVVLDEQGVGAGRLAEWKADVDLGDLVGVHGEVITTRRGELSVAATSWTLTAKALRPPPEKWRGLADPEARVRRRYVELAVNPAARELVRTRATVLRALRATLDGRGFVEVETPSLQPLPGGAAARPFRTHLNAFDVDVYLRIALELYLKRLIVGGLDRVYEIGRTYRNEGVDGEHSPEFTMLEVYQAYTDYDGIAELCRALVLAAAEAVGATVIPDGRGGEVDLTAPWRTVAVHEAVSAALGEPVSPDTGAADLRDLAAAREVELRPEWGAGEIVLELFEKLVEHTLLTPTFVRDYPASVRPLARPHRSDPRLTEAFDLVIAGLELAPGYSELADPVEQRRRLTEQALRAAAGDPEAMHLDEDFLAALEYGMPPTGGLGLGVDRLVMLLTGTSIREAITFPLVRPR
jgi:lysyl-tRNA synthetase class 2